MPGVDGFDAVHHLAHVEEPARQEPGGFAKLGALLRTVEELSHVCGEGCDIADVVKQSRFTVLSSAPSLAKPPGC